MELTTQLKREILEVMNAYWDSYLQGDLETWASFLPDNYQNIGTTREEIWESKKEIVDFTIAVLDQTVGKAEMRNKHVQILPYEPYVMVHEFGELYVKTDSGWSFYSDLRLSSLLQKVDEKWEILHQHGSYPDFKVQEGEAFGFEALKAENLKLQEAVKSRTAELEQKNRELELEMALERVRSVALAMRSPDEMMQVCRVISDELTRFRIADIRNVQILLIQEERENYLCYQYFPRYQQEIMEETYYRKNPVELAMVNKMLSSKNGYFEGSLEGKELAEFREHRKEESHFPDPYLDEVDKLFYFFYSIGYGGLGITLYDQLDEKGLGIFKRFHQVFSLAYRRFRDIEKAEAQAKEAEIELALERVRSRTMAMQQSNELGDVATVLFNEMNGLLDNLWTCGFVLCEENRQEDEWWLSMDTGFTRGFFLPNVGDFAHETLYEGWKKRESFRSVELEGKVLNDHYEWLMKIPVAKQIFADMEASGIPRPKWQKLHAAYFQTGYLVIITEVPCAEEEIFKRFALVFDQTYTRFLDLKSTENLSRQVQIDLENLIVAKRKTDEALAELKATQTQLIQAEKMASLGELTAGIAHEIQNPLNFVNNYSEVNMELIEELREEVGKVEGSRDKELEEELWESLVDNETKIHYHGKRADAIVRGMLQHSRTSSGAKEPTNLNALADEYLRLAYHGLRAKDSSFQANFNTDLDENLPLIEVMAQDMGRVLLNIINNAFQACAERSRAEEPGYQPKVIVTTRSLTNSIEIRIQDNGYGIPDTIKDKIFQPFFTTKPTGQGTGLGLSLAFDIVTKGHGGTLLVNSMVGEGTVFVISLPHDI